MCCLTAAGCAHSHPGTREVTANRVQASANAEPFAKGDLIIESFDRVHPDSPGIAATARMYQNFGPSAGVKLVDQSADRVVIDYDFDGMQASRNLPHDDHTVPARMILEMVSINGQSYAHQRTYYTGSEAAVAERWRQSYRDGPVSALVPLRVQSSR